MKHFSLLILVLFLTSKPSFAENIGAELSEVESRKFLEMLLNMETSSGEKLSPLVEDSKGVYALKDIICEKTTGCKLSQIQSFVSSSSDVPVVKEYLFTKNFEPFANYMIQYLFPKKQSYPFPAELPIFTSLKISIVASNLFEINENKPIFTLITDPGEKSADIQTAIAKFETTASLPVGNGIDNLECGYIHDGHSCTFSNGFDHHDEMNTYGITHKLFPAIRASTLVKATWDISGMQWGINTITSIRCEEKYLNNLQVCNDARSLDKCAVCIGQLP